MPRNLSNRARKPLIAKVEDDDPDGERDGVAVECKEGGPLGEGEIVFLSDERRGGAAALVGVTRVAEELGVMDPTDGEARACLRWGVREV